MPSVRLVADDLTGALDTAAELTPLAGEIAVRWAGAAEHRQGSIALDIGTREGSRAAAIQAVAATSAFLRGAEIGLLKVDSLLRGHGMAELGAVLANTGFERCVLAPAFPHQGRITRGGIQLRRTADDAWEAVADVRDLLAEAGIAVTPAAPGAALAPGVTLFDAETDADLDRIVAVGRSMPGPVLWCGSAGLASALARRAPLRAASALKGPVLGLFGSDQPATAAQLAACGRRWIALPDGSVASAARLAAALERDGAVLASLALPEHLPRAEAASRIAEGLGDLASRLPRPGTLLVAGGETLRALCGTLGAVGLDAIGQIEPGLPVSRLCGGRWDGLRVVSKSGAFGGPHLWRDLVAPHLLTADASS